MVLETQLACWDTAEEVRNDTQAVEEQNWLQQQQRQLVAAVVGHTTVESNERHLKYANTIRNQHH